MGDGLVVVGRELWKAEGMENESNWDTVETERTGKGWGTGLAGVADREM